MAQKRSTVLIVEDERAIREALAAFLTKEQFIVHTAADGAEGLATALQEQPDIILVDLLMPNVNGKTFLHKLRNDAWGMSVPVIVLTNLSADSSDTVRTMVESAPAFYLVKSDWDMHDIAQKIREVLK